MTRDIVTKRESRVINARFSRDAWVVRITMHHMHHMHAPIALWVENALHRDRDGYGRRADTYRESVFEDTCEPSVG